MQKILILSASNPASNPRPRRMIENLRGFFKLYALGIETGEIPEVQTFSFSSYQKRNALEELRLYFDVCLCRWDRLIWTKNRLEIVPFLQKYSFDFILCFDLPLLPIALKYKKKAKVIFDAQEYFPEWMTSNRRWNLLFKRFNVFLCQRYLPQADHILSVSPSFVARYAREFGISPIYYPSLPYFYDFPPPAQPKAPIKILYHGSLSSNRSIDELIRLSEGLREDFELHLVLVGGEARYRAKIKESIKIRQKKGQKIFTHPPVRFEEIIPFGRNFDIGLYFMPPKTYNLLCTIPNKFFEYIGSSLALISTPNPDLIPIIERYQLGRIAPDFSISSMLELLNSLSLEEIYRYKCASYRAFAELNNAKNQEVILRILS